MKKLLFALVASLVISPAFAQWQVPAHSVPIGQGAGITGFGSAAPSTAGQPLVSNGPNADPSFQSLPAPVTSIPARQSILTSRVAAGGFPNFATAGSGLNVNLNASANPLTMSFAGGFSSSGAVDFINQLNSDVVSNWALLPQLQYSFLAFDRNATSGAVTPSMTLIRPQRGRTFSRFRQALLHFENSLPPVDDAGNVWQSSGASLTGACAMFGSTGLSLTGTSSYVQSAPNAIQNPGQGAWTLDIWTKIPSNLNAQIFSAGNAFGLFVSTNGSGKLAINLSSTGLSWDIANGNAGGTTVTAGAWHHIALVFTGASASNPNYSMYLDGIVQVGISSSATVWPDGVAMTVGSQSGSAGSTAGCFDEFEFVPYAKWVTNFTPPAAPSVLAGDWFDTSNMVMKTITGPSTTPGTDPVFTTLQRLYVAEAVTNGGAVSAVYNYSPATPAVGADFSIDQSSGTMRSGNMVFYSATPQFYTNNNLALPDTLNAVRTFVLSPSLVPPDAKSFFVQAGFHAPIAQTSVPNQDCLYITRIPTGTGQSYGALGSQLSNYTGMGTATQSTAFTENGADAVLEFPVINGVAALQGFTTGTTCNPNGGSNDARLINMSLLGYRTP